MRNTQQGMGLIEVMVALLLLAVAILGFSALQIKAVGATDESLVRSQAISKIRDISEVMRRNVTYIADVKAVLPSSASKFTKNCFSEDCTDQEMAKFDAQQAKDKAEDAGFIIGVANCPGASSTTCILVAWGDTEPVIGTSDNQCISNEGVYNKGSNCVMMEMY